LSILPEENRSGTQESSAPDESVRMADRKEPFKIPVFLLSLDISG